MKGDVHNEKLAIHKVKTYNRINNICSRVNRSSQCQEEEEISTCSNHSVWTSTQLLIVLENEIDWGIQGKTVHQIRMNRKHQTTGGYLIQIHR